MVVDARIKRPCETSWINVEFRRIYMAEWCGNRLCVSVSFLEILLSLHFLQVQNPSTIYMCVHRLENTEETRTCLSLGW